MFCGAFPPARPPEVRQIRQSSRYSRLPRLRSSPPSMSSLPEFPLATSMRWQETRSQLEDSHLTEHPVGFRYHDPGFLILPGESAVLEPGMVITIEPGVYVPERGGGARIEDNVLVTESGPEVLSRIEGKERELSAW